ncbi:chorismate mutase [Trifolium repens]|nr:chorismate mutase [Trifolium repens]
MYRSQASFKLQARIEKKHEILEIGCEERVKDAGLQALSKRIHYGKVVAEAKFQECPSVYEVAIKVKDKKWLLELLTYETVEASVQKRVEMKAKTYSQVKRAAEFRTAGSLVCQEIELQIDVIIGGCDKHTLKLPSELGYGSSVACCGEGKSALE